MFGIKQKLINGLTSHSFRNGSGNASGTGSILAAVALTVVGLASFVWFLIRVIPKPSRATYPCMRVAAPLASSFVIASLGLLSSFFAMRKARRILAGSRYVVLIMGAGIVVAAISLSFIGIHQPGAATWSKGNTKGNTYNTDSALGPPNEPMGTAAGANPGRVVWVHDPDATDWDGPGSPEHWWEGNHTDQARVDVMLSDALCWLAGKPSDAEAWQAFFIHFNQVRGKGILGYQPGEKIAIKANLTTCNASYGGGSVDPVTGEKTVYLDKADTSMHLMLALLRQLVNVVGVAQTDISIGDTVSAFPNQWYDYLAVEFPAVHYLDHYGTLPGRTPVAFSSTPLHWSTPDAVGKVADYVPASYAAADYLINLPVLKGHAAGITICAKNHYGSLVRNPVGRAWGSYYDYYDLHLDLAASSEASGQPGQEYYRPLVDLMGHEEMGGKTLLYLVDALYCGYYWEGTPYKWNMAPFNNDWPSSLFASMDPVAVDSVGFDFLNEEWPDVVSGGTGSPGSLEGAAEDYLHEAAKAHAPDSGTFYDPENDGTALVSLGVHEHWNNALDKEYSRNLGSGDGIELVSGQPLHSWDLIVNSTPVNQVEIEGSHPGMTHYQSLIIDGSIVTLTAPQMVMEVDTSYSFQHWVLDGVEQTPGLSDLVFNAAQNIVAQAVYLIDSSMVSAQLTCTPSSGQLPFTANMTVMLTNLNQSQTRRLAGRIDVLLAGGQSYSGWRRGATNLNPGETRTSAWPQTIPALALLIGQNTFTLVAEDVTPPPYNQPPYPPAGDTDTDGCLVTGIQP